MPLIRVVVIDDHPAVRAGLVALLRQEPGFVPAATAAGIGEAKELLGARRFDVALADYQLADGNGAELCRDVRAAPPFLLYTAFSGEAVTVAARVAGAAGVVAKAAPAVQLFDALRAAAKGGQVFEPISQETVRAAARTVDESDVPLLTRALEGVPPAAIAAALDLGRDEVERRLDLVVSQVAGRVYASA